MGGGIIEDDGRREGGIGDEGYKARAIEEVSLFLSYGNGHAFYSPGRIYDHSRLGLVHHNKKRQHRTESKCDGFRGGRATEDQCIFRAAVVKIKRIV